ncbi:metal-dependent hydrolase [Sphingobacterium psychroaquaticum]|uniref:L-ascorbate metabolism protein UlaG, beta-lactamase superfamily n=1 Tax=Sphingobacterium psychroaquaticum TaxID=561061 RepID=A0A1X7HZD9_9SPHI|nr:metal-dependent hydrolase [Sphingobacterium psychroaquaticum]QBQ42186.1 metal-dependent hydrolase [Sphingobacterium psychroaquaticum]SMG07264.1 L-ascorbate metabolism protein UlaG, beta-lactamase superfamily [Sphingobacterium psychroaquaticum]
MVQVTYYGQSCVEFDFDGVKVLLDPFIRGNALAESVDVGSLRPDYIFLSHGHGDHVADMYEIQKNSDATVVSIVETAAWVRRQGVPEEKVIEYNFGGILELPFGKVKMVYALHTNSTPDGQYGGFPVGYVFFIGDKKIYFAGDTGLTMEMKLLEDLALDWSLLPIGGHYTMGVTDAIKAAGFVNCKNIIGIHYNTFPPIAIDTAAAKVDFSQAGLTLHLPAVGETMVLS